MKRDWAGQQFALLAGKRAIVTGGTEGIGQAIVQMLVRSGVHVVTCARDEAKLSATVEALGGEEGKVCGIPADVSKREDIERLFKDADTVMGGLDILIANAAVGAAGVTDMSAQDQEETLDINLKGYVLCAREAARRFERDGGKIVFIGSMSADVREAEGSVYVATKAGVQGLAGAFRKEVNERGIHVTLIEPGAIATPMQGLEPDEEADQLQRQEMMRPEDVADCVAFALTKPSRCDVVAMQVRPHRQII